MYKEMTDFVFFFLHKKCWGRSETHLYFCLALCKVIWNDYLIEQFLRDYKSSYSETTKFIAPKLVIARWTENL